jgi:hypothetical protein
MIMRYSIIVAAAAMLALGSPNSASARGFGAARGGVAVGRGGFSASSARAGAVAGPFGAAAGGSRGVTRVTPGGTTIQAGRVGGVSRGPLGGVHAAGAQGARVTTPGGRSFTTGSAGRAGVGAMGGAYASGVRGSAAVGPYGASASFRRGGVAIGPGGGVVAGRTVGVGHATPYWGASTLRTTGVAVRGGYRYPYFNRGWYGAHPGAWAATHWVAPNYWVAPAWPTVATYVGVVAPPILYDYGSSVIINDNRVYIDGEQAGTAEEYAGQALAFADQGREAKPAENDEWQSLGVFGAIQGDEQVAQRIFQLAVNKKGVVRGNYYDAVADNTLPVYGSVDPKTQRVAWSIGDKKNIVFEAGLNNLTQDQTTALVHYGKDNTQEIVLIRLEEPTDDGAQPSP